MSTRNHTCLFCAIIAGDAPATVKHETEAMVCILDAYPVSDGHALLSRERIEHVNGFDAAANSYAITSRTGAVNHRAIVMVSYSTDYNNLFGLVEMRQRHMDFYNIFIIIGYE